MRDLDPADLIAFADAWARLDRYERRNIELLLDGRHDEAERIQVESAKDEIYGLNEQIDNEIDSFIVDSNIDRFLGE